MARSPEAFEGRSVNLDRAFRAIAPLGAVLAWGGVAHADAPLSYLRTHGLHANAGTTLIWGMMIISIAVVVIVTILLLAAVFRRREPPLPGQSVVERPPQGRGWIAVGTGISTVVLFAVTVWTVLALAEVAMPPPGNAAAPVRLEVIGHQWWWEVRYFGDHPSLAFTTANEIHIPVGQTVPVTLTGLDVIHSFWVPALAGKTDVIPGQTNETWLEAQTPGIYRGQCTEYCGAQHAHMAFEVIASSPEEFEAWWKAQLANPTTDDERALAGQNLFLEKCAVCHAIRGTRADGVFGPNLSHLTTRSTLAAGTVPNTPGYLSAWIADPQNLKPGSLMPRIDLSAAELEEISRYLQSLR
jgi:cytochrome c oxidase subunit 2